MTHTVVFSDLQGSTALGERLEAETLRSVLTRYFDEMTLVLRGHGGTVEKIIGDAIVTVFEGPDHAGRAVRAVAEAAQALDVLNLVLAQTYGVELVSRTGVGTGELTVGGDPATGRVLSGQAIDTAMALEVAAPPFGALLSGRTTQAVDGLAVTERHVATGSHLLLSTAAQPPLHERCRRCGSEHSADLDCASVPDRHESRRTVTVVFADPRPEWTRSPSADETARAMASYFQRVKGALASHGATIERFIGDAVMAVFGLPVRHEDDAARALRSAIAVRDAVNSLNRELESDGIAFDTRIGVNTGSVVAGDAESGQRLVTGDAVNVAARLEQAAGPGEILVGEITVRLAGVVAETESVDPLVLKGKSDPVPAHRLLGVRAGRTRFASSVPMVGRESELATLIDVAASEGPGPSRAVVVGEAGVGKSRLVAALVSAVGDRTRVLRGHCLEYGDGITLWPLAEMVRAAAGVRDDDAPRSARGRIERLVGDDAVSVRLASIAGLHAAQFPMAELAWSVRRLLEAMSSEQPVVAILEDAQWAEEALLDLIDDAFPERSPVSLIVVARPGLEGVRPAWFEDRGATIRLEPLTDDDVGVIVESIVGGAASQALRTHVAAASDGNPLFAEQVVWMLRDSGAISPTGEGWDLATGRAASAVPATIDALLGARLDALEATRRRILAAASVVGRRFPTPALDHMLTDDVEHVSQHLDALVAAALTEVVAEAAVDDDEIHGFRHLLLRDVAYDGLLKATRAELHERFVEWADRVNARRGRELEFEEILGYHLEQAHRYRAEVAVLDAHGVEIGIEAARRLDRAGERALLRGDIAAASGLTARAVDLLPTGHEDQPRLMLRLGECRFETGAFDEGRATVEAAAEAARAADDRSVELAAELDLLRMAADTGADQAEILEAVERLRPAVEAHGSPAALTRMWRLLATFALVAMRWTEAEEAARRMVDNARLSGDVATELRVLPALAGIARYGPLPVADAIALCDELLERTGTNRRAEVFTLLPRARLLAMQGDFDVARDEYRAARSTLQEMGWSLDAALVSLDSGPIELLAGDPATAVAELSADREALLSMGDDYYVATTTALLAEGRYRLGELEAAGSLAAEVESIADPDDIAPQYMWRVVAARIAAAEGERRRAIELLDAAGDLVDADQDPNALGAVLTARTEALMILGDGAAALAAGRRAREAFERKGNVAAIHRLDGLLARSEVNQ